MKRVSKKFLESMAKQVRGWVEDEDLKRQYPRPGLNGFCAIASAELSRRLMHEGIPHEIHMSSSEDGSHVYVVIDDVVYDVTATQFPQYKDTKVLIKHTREAEVNWFHQVEEIFRNAEELRNYQIRARWPKDQTAYAA